MSHILTVRTFLIFFFSSRRRPTILAGPGRKMHSRRWGFGGSPSFGGSVEELAQLLAEGEAGAVQAALDGRDGQVERVGDVLVGEAVHVLEQEHGPVVVGQL